MIFWLQYPVARGIIWKKIHSKTCHFADTNADFVILDPQNAGQNWQLQPSKFWWTSKIRDFAHQECELKSLPEQEFNLERSFALFFAFLRISYKFDYFCNPKIKLLKKFHLDMMPTGKNLCKSSTGGQMYAKKQLGFFLIGDFVHEGPIRCKPAFWGSLLLGAPT